MADTEGDHTETLLGDAEIIARVRAGDNAAFGTLYERHASAARGLARQLLRVEAEAEDAVAEAFTKVLSVIQRGGGPSDAFRPYLLTAVRNAAYDRGRGEKRQVVTDDMDGYDPGEPFVDPALEGLERSLIARAFLSLPERWQSVLWHTEIEGTKPADVATILGMNPNGVSALAYRAREGLRQAYLQMHLAGSGAAKACRPTLDLLGAYVRGGLAKRDTAKVDRHMDDCGDCRAVYAELMDVNVGLRGVVLPLVVGSGATGYLTTVPGATAMGGPATAGAWWNRMSRGGKQAVVGSTAAASVAVALALASVGADVPMEEDPSSTAAPLLDAPAEDPPPPVQMDTDDSDDTHDPLAVPLVADEPAPVFAPPVEVLPVGAPERGPSEEMDVPEESTTEPETEPEPEPEPETEPEPEPEPETEPEPEPETEPESECVEGIHVLLPGGVGIVILVPDQARTGTVAAHLRPCTEPKKPRCPKPWWWNQGSGDTSEEPPSDPPVRAPAPEPEGPDPLRGSTEPTTFGIDVDDEHDGLGGSSGGEGSAEGEEGGFHNEVPELADALESGESDRAPRSGAPAFEEETNEPSPADDGYGHSVTEDEWKAQEPG